MEGSNSTWIIVWLQRNRGWGGVGQHDKERLSTGAWDICVHDGASKGAGLMRLTCVDNSAHTLWCAADKLNCTHIASWCVSVPTERKEVLVSDDSVHMRRRALHKHAA